MRKYTKAFTLGLQNALEYRMNFLLILISCIFPILIQYFLWTTIFVSKGDSEVLGYNFNQIIVYTICAALLSKLVATGFEYEVSNDVKNGQLSKFLVQPIGYFQYRISSFLGEKTPQIIVVMLILFIILTSLSLFIHMETEITLARMLMFFLVVPISILLNFFISYCLSTLSFWLLEVWGIYHTFGLLSSIASGGIFPLDMFGATINRILDFLPFKYIVFFPINVINGKLPWDGIMSGVLMQFTWIFVLFLLSKLLWYKGMQRFESVGG
ncbi:ABC transporter permease [Paenibacillus monticola]|uniref:ABC transporter permease n=1 Tax=Paenibacillus monticola TaxID=2666075 RepID=A0A7X2HBW9_9BACL|nr:ABC-2 family transporter protein [Paenibacillus monticola]MRN57272.1 ABC transporter permease [Paenibacillus monticola]